jgi:hypothetical protein
MILIIQIKMMMFTAENVNLIYGAGSTMVGISDMCPTVDGSQQTD